MAMSAIYDFNFSIWSSDPIYLSYLIFCFIWGKVLTPWTWRGQPGGHGFGETVVASAPVSTFFFLSLILSINTLIMASDYL